MSIKLKEITLSVIQEKEIDRKIDLIIDGTKFLESFLHSKKDNQISEERLCFIRDVCRENKVYCLELVNYWNLLKIHSRWTI